MGKVEADRQPPSIAVASSVVRSLVEAGVTRFVYAPGSRNAPFAYVLAAYEGAGLISVSKFVEERGGGFFAVGTMLAERQPEPTAVFTTSGTAVAELYPAVLEAHHQHLPLVLVTADRPFEVLRAGASQTTDQTGIFGSFVVAQASIPAAETSDQTVLGGVETQVRRIVGAARGWGGAAGPTHLNVHFREPLVPTAPIVPGMRPDVQGAQRRPQFVTRAPSSVPFSDVGAARLSTLVIAGDGALRQNGLFGCEGAHVQELVEGFARAGVPMVAEPSSRLTTLPNWIPHGPWVLDALAQEVEQVVVIGRPTLSRQVSGLLASQHVRKIVVSADNEWPDQSGTADTVVSCLQAPTVQVGPDGWMERWLAVSDAIGSVIEGHNSSGSAGLTHLAVAAEIWRAQVDVDLWLGPSNPIRMFDIAAGRPGRNGVFSNRGLAGIDGAIAQAFGVHVSRGRPLRAVLGDLTYLYDLPSLAARPNGVQDVQIIILDDGGGTIFGTLEHGSVASQRVLRDYFTLPPDVDFLRAARACGWQAQTASSLAQLRRVLSEPVSGLSVVRIPLEAPARLLAQLRAECGEVTSHVE